MISSGSATYISGNLPNGQNITKKYRLFHDLHFRKHWVQFKNIRGYSKRVVKFENILGFREHVRTLNGIPIDDNFNCFLWIYCDFIELNFDNNETELKRNFTFFETENCFF